MNLFITVYADDDFKNEEVKKAIENYYYHVLTTTEDYKTTEENIVNIYEIEVFKLDYSVLKAIETDIQKVKYHHVIEMNLYETQEEFLDNIQQYNNDTDFYINTLRDREGY